MTFGIPLFLMCIMYRYHTRYSPDGFWNLQKKFNIFAQYYKWFRLPFYTFSFIDPITIAFLALLPSIIVRWQSESWFTGLVIYVIFSPHNSNR